MLHEVTKANRGRYVNTLSRILQIVQTNFVNNLEMFLQKLRAANISLNERTKTAISYKPYFANLNSTRQISCESISYYSSKQIQQKLTFSLHMHLLYWWHSP